MSVSSTSTDNQSDMDLELEEKCNISPRETFVSTNAHQSIALIDESLEDSVSASLTTAQERILAFVQEFLRQRAGQQNPLPKAQLMDPSVVDQYLVMKRLIDEGFLTVPPETTICVDRSRWRGSKPVASSFMCIEYPRGLSISSADLTHDYTFTETDTNWASSSEERWITCSQQPWTRDIEKIEQRFFEVRMHRVIETRPYTAHPVWNSVMKRGPMKVPELEAIVEEAGKIEEADYKTFEESLVYCDSDTRPGSAPLEDLPFQTVFYKLLSALHRLCGELEPEAIFSDMTDVQSQRQKRTLEGVSSLRDATNSHIFMQFIDMMHFCMVAPKIHKCVTLLVQKHAEDLREILRSRQLAPELKALLVAHANRHNQ